MLKGSKQLKQLVSHSTELWRLEEAINHLRAIQNQLAQLDEPLQGVAGALGESAARHLTVNKSGLMEFKTVIELISTLDPSYWKHRSELFDNEELDELLPQLRNDIDEFAESSWLNI